MNSLLRKTLRAEVSLIRLPLQVLDDRVVSRYAGQDSRVRHTLQTALAVVDQAAGMLADVPGASAASGTATAASRTAAHDTAEPSTSFSETATEVPEPGAPMPEPEREEVAELTAELLEEQEEETFAGELADDDELRRVQAALQAKRLVEEAVETSVEESARTD